jgi:hypothetical protein
MFGILSDSRNGIFDLAQAGGDLASRTCGATPLLVEFQRQLAKWQEMSFLRSAAARMLLPLAINCAHVSYDRCAFLWLISLPRPT